MIENEKKLRHKFIWYKGGGLKYAKEIRKRNSK